MDLKWRRGCLWLAFAAYCAGMAWLLFFQRTPGNAAVNLVPLRTILKFWRDLSGAETRRNALIQLTGNVGTFLPLGWFLPRLWSRARRLGWCLMAVTALAALIEFCQLATGLGCCDLDDVILNDCGAALGFLLWRAGQRGGVTGEKAAWASAGAGTVGGGIRDSAKG